MVIIGDCSGIGTAGYGNLLTVDCIDSNSSCESFGGFNDLISQNRYGNSYAGCSCGNGICLCLSSKISDYGGSVGSIEVEYNIILCNTSHGGYKVMCIIGFGFCYSESGQRNGIYIIVSNSRCGSCSGNGDWLSVDSVNHDCSGKGFGWFSDLVTDDIYRNGNTDCTGNNGIVLSSLCSKVAYSCGCTVSGGKTDDHIGLSFTCHGSHEVVADINIGLRNIKACQTDSVSVIIGNCGCGCPCSDGDWLPVDIAHRNCSP